MLPNSFTPAFLRQLELLKIRSRRAFLGSRQGGHLSLKRGHGLEFSDYRKYELGDHPRYIDWGLYARSQRLYVKRFQEEQDISVLIILDASASMNIPEEGGKWQRAKEIALALAYVALSQQDNVTLAALGKSAGPIYQGLKSIHHLSDLLGSMKAEGKIDLQRETILAAGRIRFPGIAVFISDFLMPFEELQRAFTFLRSKNLDISAIQILHKSDEDPFHESESYIAVDSESGEEVSLAFEPDLQASYKKHFNNHLHRLSDYCKNNRIAYAKVNSENSVKDIFSENLSYLGLMS